MGSVPRPSYAVGAMHDQPLKYRHTELKGRRDKVNKLRFRSSNGNTRQAPGLFIRRIAAALALVVLASSVAFSRPRPRMFHARLSSELELSQGFLISGLLAETDADQTLGGLRRPAGAKWFSGSSTLIDGREFQTVLIESETGDVDLYADVNFDAVLDQSERVVLSNSQERGVRARGRVYVPVGGNRFKRAPVELVVGAPGPGKPIPGRILYVNSHAVVAATFMLDGVPARFEYPVDLRSGKVLLSGDTLGADTNLDGKIDYSGVSPENAYADSRGVIFRVGNRYFSTVAINSKRGTATLVEHDKTAYRRIELTPGTRTPDFSFIDQRGRRRRLSEFSGRPVLLVFWASWCPPCVGDLPFLQQFAAEYEAKGLVVLGMNADKSSRVDRSFVKRNGITWLQAMPESIHALVNQRFQIVEYPTRVLINGDRTILASGDVLLEKESLREACNAAIVRAKGRQVVSLR